MIRPTLARRSLSLAAVTAALLSSGCVTITGQSDEQRDLIGDVVLTTEQCTSPAFAEAGSCVPVSGQRGQLLLGHLVPDGAQAPATVTATAGTETLEYAPSDSYTAALERHTPSGDGDRWVGYLSAPVTAGDRAEFVTTARFGLPAGGPGRPYAGPLPYRTMVGYRSVPAGGADAPVTCETTTVRQEPEGPVLTPGGDDCFRSQGTGARSAPTRDLALAPRGKPPVVVAGGTVSVPFDAAWAGALPPGDAAFDLAAATPLAGATAVPGQDALVVAGAATPLAVTVTVPAGTAPGAHGVTLTATVAERERSSADRPRRSAVGGFVVVAPPAKEEPKLDEQPKADPPKAEAPPAPAAPVAVTVPSQTVTVASTCASRRSFRIRLRQRRGDRFRSAVVRVDGKRVTTLRGARVTAPVDLTGLPKGRFTVSITATTTDGRTLSGERCYRTCTPKRAGGVPLL